MTDPARVRDAIRELQHLTACYCEPPWTDRGLHQPDCAAEYRDDLQTLIDALPPEAAE